MKKILLSLACILLLSGCGLFRTAPAERIIVRTTTEYKGIPESLINCPPPPIVEPEAIQSESDYNREFVLRLYNNNEICFLSAEQIKNYNKLIEAQSGSTDEEDDR